MNEKIGFKRDVMIVPTSAMQNQVAESLCCNSSHDCRTIAKAALICRREIASYRYNNNHKFTVEAYGFKEQCQETAVPVALKFLVGMITRRPSAEETVTVTKATLSIAQLVFFNTTPKTPIAQRHLCRYWTLRSFKVQEWRNGGCVG